MNQKIDDLQQNPTPESFDSPRMDYITDDEPKQWEEQTRKEAFDKYEQQIESENKELVKGFIDKREEIQKQIDALKKELDKVGTSRVEAMRRGQLINKISNLEKQLQ